MMEKQINQHEYISKPGRVGIVGLGLIGGSLARALHHRAAFEIVGLDRKQTVLDAAIGDGVLTDAAILPPAPADWVEATASELDESAAARWQKLADCEVVFICTPTATVPGYTAMAARFCDGLLTDVASVKQPVMEKIPLDRFVGGHPMAGSEKAGYAHSSDILLENAVYVLCLKPDSLLPVSSVQRLEQIVRLTGATPMHLSAQIHDRVVATISHLPHVAAAALALQAAHTDEGPMSCLAAGGFRDITRIASSDAGLWAGISRENARELLPVLDQYISLLAEFRESLAGNDDNGLSRFFHQAAHYRNSLPVDGRGALTAMSPLNVYVPDHPGVLGHVTTLLGENGVNISNIRIRELRAYEGGCLQLLLPDSAQAVKAAWLLKEAGYECD